MKITPDHQSHPPRNNQHLVPAHCSAASGTPMIIAAGAIFIC